MFEEDFRTVWRLRYGSDPSAEIPELVPFLRHRSVRKFADREVPESLVAGLVAAAQSASTSSNLQLYSIVSVQDPALRAEVARCCADQKQVHAAPWFFAFLADHHRLRRAAKSVDEGAEGLDFLEFFLMAAMDAALAAERMTVAAESVGLGVCYIGALRNDPEGIARLLDLPEGVFGLFGLCIGYPADGLSAEIKPRLPQDVVWFRDRYNAEAGLGDYDVRMREFYEAQQMKGEVTWSMRSGRRVDGRHMTGREVLLGWLRERGFLRR